MTIERKKIHKKKNAIRCKEEEENLSQIWSFGFVVFHDVPAEEAWLPLADLQQIAKKSSNNAPDSIEEAAII